MKLNLKGLTAGIATLAVAGSGLLIAAAPASAAASAPPFEPDAYAAAPYGNVIFYDAQGNQVTSGTDMSAPFAYAVAVTNGESLSSKANLAFAKPESGVDASFWPATAEAGPTTFSPASSLPAGTPADIAAYAPAHPVVNTPTANLSTFFAADGTDSNPGYQYTAEVRLTDNKTPSGSYWESDVAFNPTSATITVDGVSIPPNGWAQVFPVVTPSTTSLASDHTGNVTSGTPVTLTATVPAGDAGTVQFFDGSTSVGSATVSGGTASFGPFTPADGSHSFTASFVPNLGDETGAGTSSASIVGGSTSSAVSLTETVPQVATSTALSATSQSIAYGASDTFTATVTENDTATTGLAGSVQFFDGSTALGSPIATTVGASSSTAQLTTSSLPAGTDNITATFTPTNNGYAPSTSAAVPVTVAAPAACSLTGSVCSDPQGVSVTVNPGTITISTPYTAANPFVLPAMTLQPSGGYLYSTASFPKSSDQQIVVTSQLAGDPAWTLSVASTDLTNGSGGTIPASGLGLTAGQLSNTSTIPGGVSFTDIPGKNPSPVSSDPNTSGASGLSATPQTFATSPAGDGTAVMSGTLSLFAATTTPAGTYTGTITFSVV